MKKNSQWFLLFFLSSVSLSALWYFFIYSEEKITAVKGNKSLNVKNKKNGNDNIKIKTAKSDDPKKTNQKAPNTKPDPLPEKNSPTLLPGKIFIKDREVVGAGLASYAQKPYQIKMQNTYNPHWKKYLLKNLLRFQPPGTTIEVKRKSSYIRIYNFKGKYIEKVLVETTLPNGQKFSFHANVDSASGHILETWDRTRYEWANRPSEGLTPSGTL